MTVADDGRIAAIVAEVALVGTTRVRMRDRAAQHDRRSELLTGATFLVATIGWFLVARPAVPAAMLAACVAAYVVAGSVEFEIGPGCAIPTMPVQVLMLFLLPAPLVPVAVLLGLIGAALVGAVRDLGRRERPLVVAGSGWQVVGPAAVFAYAHVGAPAWSDWRIYVFALAAQFALDAASSWTRNCYGLGVPARHLVRALQVTFACDLFLAPAAFAAAIAVPRSAGALLVVLPLVALLALLQADRRRQIDATLALGAAITDTHNLARRDVLTGLANRLAWEEAIARCRESDVAVGVVLADVDGLKAANDTLGHETGDRLLVAVAAVLTRVADGREHSVVARVGGDEFGILLPGATPESAPELQRALAAAFALDLCVDDVVPVSASVGAGFSHSGLALGAAIATADRQVNTSNAAASGAGRRRAHGRASRCSTDALGLTLRSRSMIPNATS